MLRELFSRWFRQPEQTNLDEIPDEAIFLNGQTYGGQPHLPGIGRDYSDQMKACQLRDCQRPSAYDVVTLQHLDVDIAFSRQDKLYDTDPPLNLPTYQFYAICDRHYAEFVRGKAPNGESTKLVIGPAVSYKVDEAGAKL